MSKPNLSLTFELFKEAASNITQLIASCGNICNTSIWEMRKEFSFTFDVVEKKGQEPADKDVSFVLKLNKEFLAKFNLQSKHIKPDLYEALGPIFEAFEMGYQRCEATLEPYEALLASSEIDRPVKPYACVNTWGRPELELSCHRSSELARALDQISKAHNHRSGRGSGN